MHYAEFDYLIESHIANSTKRIHFFQAGRLKDSYKNKMFFCRKKPN